MVVEKCNNRERVTQKLLSLFCEKVDECLKTKELVKFAEYSCAVTPQVRQTGNRLSGLAGTAYASLFT